MPAGGRRSCTPVAGWGDGYARCFSTVFFNTSHSWILMMLVFFVDIGGSSACPAELPCCTGTGNLGMVLVAPQVKRLCGRTCTHTRWGLGACGGMILLKPH